MFHKAKSQEAIMNKNTYESPLNSRYASKEMHS